MASRQLTRRDYGKDGFSTDINTNHLPIYSLPDIPINLYHVQVTRIRKPGAYLAASKTLSNDEAIKHQQQQQSAEQPDKVSTESRLFNRRVWASSAVRSQLGKDWEHFVYDSANFAFNTVAVPGFRLSFTEGSDDVTVELRPTRVISFKPLRQYITGHGPHTPDVSTAMTMLRLLVFHVPQRYFYVTGQKLYGRTMDDRSACVIFTGTESYIEFRKGFTLVPRFGLGRVNLNIDITRGVFWNSNLGQMSETTVLNLVCNILRTAPASLDNRTVTALSLRKLIQPKPLTFYVKHLRQKDETTIRPRKLDRIVRDTARSFTFEYKSPGTKISQRISVFEYFLRRYNITLQYPDIPMIVSRDSYFPMEVCYITPMQKFTIALEHVQTTEMIKLAAMQPGERRDEIISRTKELDWEQDPTLKHFGVDISPDMMTTKGRVLPSPVIALGNDARITSSFGRWDFRGRRYVKSGQPLESWGILAVCTKRDMPETLLDEFLLNLFSTVSNHGFNVPNHNPIVHFTAGGEEISESLHILYDQVSHTFRMPCQLIMFVLPNKAPLLWSQVKRVCDVELGVMSQGIQLRNMKKPSVTLCGNIGMKLNAKLGGALAWPLRSSGTQLGGQPFFAVPTLFIGADVAHPPITDVQTRLYDQNRPSIAALSGSLDAQGTRYMGEARAQTTKTEIIEAMYEMVTNILVTWLKHNPTKRLYRFMYFRDGISEGQYGQILDHELIAIKRACADLQLIPPPTITVTICRKRHLARFWPAGKDGDRSGNCRAGTVVDRDIVHPTGFEYCNCPHFLQF